MLMLFCVLLDEPIIVKGGYTIQKGGRSNRSGRADKEELSDERVLRCNKDNTEVDILAPSAETLNWHRVLGEENMDALDGHIVRFTRLLGEGWVQEAVDDGVDRLDMHDLISSCQLLGWLGRILDPWNF